MSKLQKYLYILIALVGVCNDLTASYEYDIANRIGSTIVVKINQERTDNKDYYQIIPYGKTVKQTFPPLNAWCLRKLSWAPYDKTAPYKGGMDLVDKTTGRIPEEKQRLFGDQIAPNYAFLPMEIIIEPNEIFQQTVKAAEELVQGIDALTCQTIDAIISINTFGLLGGQTKCNFGLGQMARASGKLAGGTLCKSRQFIITPKVDNNNKPMLKYGQPMLLAVTVEGE
jgi:hypothetical protein